jgi:hypothetical protein
MAGIFMMAYNDYGLDVELGEQLSYILGVVYGNEPLPLSLGDCVTEANEVKLVAPFGVGEIV